MKEKWLKIKESADQVELGDREAKDYVQNHCEPSAPKVTRLLPFIKIDF